MKAFFAKALAWMVGHKAITIAVAAVLVVGVASAAILPGALHEHAYAEGWSSDADSHWHSATCKHTEEKSDVAAHTYDNACDTTCNVCGYTRTVGAHVYDNACDTACNVCSATRTVEPHVYDNACDTACNVCNATRTITHDHADTLTAGDTTHWYACSVCGDKKDEAAHVFDQTVAHSDYLKAEATATAKAQYYKSCVCGKASTTEYFETDKTAATLESIQDLSKTYDKVELQNPTYETNSDGAVTIEWYKGNTKLDAKPVNAGTYKVKVIIAESVTFAGTSAEKEFTIAKVVVTIPALEKVYDGYGEFEFVFEGPAGEEIDCLIDIGKANANAGVYTDVAISRNSVSSENYEITATTVSATITKCLVWAENVEFVYDGENAHYGDYAVSAIAFQNVVPGETINACDIVFKFNNKNVGSSLTAVGYDDGITGNYEFDLSKCTASIVKRSIWATGAEFTYGNCTNWTGEESPSQIVFQNMASGETMDSSFVKWTFASKNVGAALTGVAFEDEDDGRSNYEIDFSKCTASIIPKVIDNLTYAFEYNGEEYHQVVISKNEHDGIIGDDQLFLEVCFVTKNVGAALDTSEETGFEPGFVDENYVLGENYTFSVVPKVVTLKEGEKIEATVTYNGQKQFALSVSSNMFDGYVDTDAATLWLTATLPSKNVGEYTDGVTLKPYVGNPALGTASQNYDFSEVAATVTIKPLTVSLSSYVKVEYNGTSEFTLATPFDLTSANTGGGQDSVSDRDEVYITWIETSNADITDETFAIDYTLGGADAGNYDIDELGVEITKKKLTNLHLYITSDTYESGEITLIAKDGVVAGEVVKISITDVNDQDFWEGFSIFMQLADGTAPDAYRYETIALIASGDYANYELATYDDGSGYQVVGIVEGVARCDVQYDGSCNCGTSHLTYEAKSSDIRTTVPCATTWTGGIYKITTEAGYWSILPSDNFADITAIYDAKGNEVMIDGNDAGFYAEAGTYYVHIGKASDLGSAQNIQFTYTNTLVNYESGGSAKSAVVSGNNGDILFFRIEKDAPWGASMNLYSDDETTSLDPTKYTVVVYDEYFHELTDVVYDGTDVYHTTDDTYSVIGKTLYIGVVLSADTNVQVYIY